MILGQKIQISCNFVCGQNGHGNDVCWCFEIVLKWSRPYMTSLSLTFFFYHCITRCWFPCPPLTLMLDSEGIILRLDSATTLYQKPFRGSRQVTSLVHCSQDHISLCDASILSKYYKDNILTNKISVFLNPHKPHFVVAFFEITKIV